MENKLKFRFMDRNTEEFYDVDLYGFEEKGITEWPDSSGPVEHVVQHVGLLDINDNEWYHKDLGEFQNGDRFVIEKEDWLEFYIDWVGDPECEDQARDFYRIRNAKRIKNTLEI